MTFHEVLFPIRVAFGSSGGPSRRTDVVDIANGEEERNAVWANSRRKYDAGQGIKSLDDVDKVVQFFEARYGRLYGFRYKDPFDHKSCNPSGLPTALDQVIGTGDGSTKAFQLKKTYTDGTYSYSRDIKKPVQGSVRASVNGTETTDFTVDLTTGIVTFTSAPTNTHIIRAGFQFHVPVRFDTDELVLNATHFQAGQIPSIPIVEIRPR